VSPPTHGSAREALVLLHHPADGLGAIGRELRAREVSLRVVRAHEGGAVPATAKGASALVVMGGPMSCDDERAHPFLADEKRLIASALDAHLPILGVCLGAQLLASVLGASVAPAPAKEIGWHEVHRAYGEARDPLFDLLPRAFTPFHWHGDALALPPGATGLAHSAQTPVQAFRHGAAYGIQFHLESDAAMIAQMAASFEDELRAEGIAADALASTTRAHIDAQQRLGALLFGAWADGVAHAHA
jgi:GMP synthase (glutamine-hydrolysing)